MFMPRVLLAESLALEREALEAVLQAASFEIVAHAASGPDAVRLDERTRPELAILDARMPGLSGIDVGRELSRFASPVPWVLLTNCDEEQQACDALAAGASAYVLRTQSGRELVRAMLDALEGRINVASGVHGFGSPHRQTSVLIS
jgi:DNA-binding NarL/FixJ family response regulator